MSAAEALAPEQSASEVRESLSVTEKGQPANTIGNCRTVFCHDPLLRGAIRLNLLTDRVDIVRDLGWRRNTSALTDTDVKYLLLYFEQNYGLTSEKKMTAALSIVASRMDFSPENSRTTTKRTLFFCCLLFSIGYLHRVAGQTIAHRQRSPATNLQKPVNYRLACKSYFLNFLEKSRCFRCRR